MLRVLLLSAVDGVAVGMRLARLGRGVAAGASGRWRCGTLLRSRTGMPLVLALSTSIALVAEDTVESRFLGEAARRLVSRADSSSPTCSELRLRFLDGVPLDSPLSGRDGVPEAGGGDSPGVLGIGIVW
jgi:hypothetical protein